MKIQIRRGIFETNSSSTHSLTMCTNDDFDKWKNGELVYNNYGDKLIPITDEKYQEWLKNKQEDDYYYDYLTYDEYFNYYCENYESFEEEFTTPSGETVIAFGYYGYDS